MPAQKTESARKSLKHAYTKAAPRQTAAEAWAAEVRWMENANNREDAERLSRHVCEIRAGRAWAFGI